MNSNYSGKYGTDEKTNIIDDLFNKSTAPESDSSDILSQNLIDINMDEINTQAQNTAESITTRLAGYFIDEKYINEHPYIKNKIAQEIDAIRRLIKMISVNEKAQDAILKLIGLGMAKAQIFTSLTALQTTMINIQTKLDTSTKALEKIFEDMQNNSEQTFEDKAKEENDNGQMVAAGARDLIKQITEKMNGTKHVDSDETVCATDYDAATDSYYDPQTGEVINQQ